MNVRHFVHDAQLTTETPELRNPRHPDGLARPLWLTGLFDERLNSYDDARQVFRDGLLQLVLSREPIEACLARYATLVDR